MTLLRKPRVGIRYPKWSSFGPVVLRGIVDTMREHRESWRLVTENDSHGEMEAVKIDGSWSGDGLILFRATEEELAGYRERGLPVVLTSSEGPDLGYPRVLPDNEQIGRLAARHLLESRISHFAFIGRSSTFYLEEEFAPGPRVYSRQRFRGFRMELGTFCFEPYSHHIEGRPLWEANTWREIQIEVAEFLASLPQPCGLFAADDSLAAVVLNAAETIGIRVPDSLAVIGYGDDPNYCHATSPALSSIRHPAREVGRAAAALLRAQWSDSPVNPMGVILPVTEVVQRESSDTLAIPDPEIRDLVRHIRLHAPTDPLRVAELAERSPLAFTTIKNKFNTYLGHGPKQEIQRVRLRHLQHLLANTDLPITEIARQMNFSSSHELSRFLVLQSGQRPLDFRNHSRGSSAGTGDPCAAVVFDLDGTLIDTEPLYQKAYAAALAFQGGRLSPAEYEQSLVGRCNARIEEAAAAFAPDGFDRERFAREWRVEFAKILAAAPPAPLPGVTNALDSLAAFGMKFALASSSDKADVHRCLDLAGLGKRFQVVATGDEVASGKPSPDVYLLACQRLGVPARQCWAVEDSVHGVNAALAAGMRVVWIHPGPAEQREKVWQVPSFAGIPPSFWRKPVMPRP